MPHEKTLQAAPDSSNTSDAPVAPAQETSIDRFLTAFERSARRWEIVVYPALLAFIVLAAYGFFLIYNLSYDMHAITQSIDPKMGEHMVQLSSNMQDLTDNVTVMTGQVQNMSSAIQDISGKMDNLEVMRPMLTRMEHIDSTMQNMGINMDMMRQDIARMSKNVSRPMSILNGMMPW